MFKKILMTIFLLILVISFSYGFIEVYTNSYNALNENHIIGFSIDYSQDDKTLHTTILGKDFTLNF